MPPPMVRANARALRKGEFSAVAVAYASTTIRATSTEASRAVVREAAGEACERAAATRWKPSQRELDDVLRGVRASLVENDEDDGVFELVCALVEVDGAIEAFIERGLAADVARRTVERRPYAARGLEACRAIVRRVDECTSDVDVVAVVDTLKPALRFARTVLNSKSSTSAAAVQAALFLALACDVVGHIDVADDWRVKAREVLESSSISVHTLVGPMVKYMTAARVNEKARAELKRAARVTAPVLLPPEPLAYTSGTLGDDTIDNCEDMHTHIDEQLMQTPVVSPVALQTPPATNDGAVDDEAEDVESHNQTLERAYAVDAPFATRRHFACDFESPLPVSTKLADLFYFEIDAVCAYADQFEETLALTVKWVRKCAATLRRSVVRKVNLTSNRPMEYALRACLDTQITALTRLLKLAKILGARNLLLVNADKALISMYNVESWISSAFGWIRVAARREQCLTSYAVLAMCCYDPSAQRFSKSDYIPLRLAFTRWSRFMYAHRIRAKRQLLALVHYENTLLRKSFNCLREFAPYHRERVADLARIAGLRWRANAHVMATRVGGAMGDELDITFPADISFGETSDEPALRRTLSRRDSFAPISSSGAPSTGRARSRKTRSIASKSSVTSVGERDDDLDVVADSSFTLEQMLVYDAFQAWIEHTYVQLSIGPNGIALKHRSETLMRKAFKAMRRYVVRSVGVREKYGAIEQATRSLDFYVTGGAAFNRWIAGVRYIKRLYAFVDEEVERWTVELRLNCFQAWREIAASRSAATMWEEQMLADVMPKMDNNTRRAWLRRWSLAVKALIERRVEVARKHYLTTLLRQWHSRTQALIVSRVVASVFDNLSLD